MSNVSDLLLAAFRKSSCSTFRGVGGYEVTGNSVVRYSPDFLFLRAASLAFADASPDHLRVGVNRVAIFGPVPAGETVHTHISHLLALVIRGHGTLHAVREGALLIESVVEGDVVVIPKGAPHLFEGDPELEYVALEFGPLIDYQKHHYAE